MAGFRIPNVIVAASQAQIDMQMVNAVGEGGTTDRILWIIVLVGIVAFLIFVAFFRKQIDKNEERFQKQKQAQVEQAAMAESEPEPEIDPLQAKGQLEGEKSIIQSMADSGMTIDQIASITKKTKKELEIILNDK